MIPARAITRRVLLVALGGVFLVAAVCVAAAHSRRATNLRQAVRSKADSPVSTSPFQLKPGGPLPLTRTVANDFAAIVRKTCTASQPSDPSVICHYLRLASAAKEFEYSQHADRGLRIGMPEMFRSADDLLRGLVENGTALRKSSRGLRVTLLEGDSRFGAPRVVGESHPGQSIACFAECSIPLSDPISLRDKRYTIEDLVNDAAWCINKHEELEWRVVALALYRPYLTGWTNKFGEAVTWTSLTVALLDSLESTKRGEVSGACSGTHALYALTVLTQINESYSIWPKEVERRVAEVQAQAVSSLQRTQASDGSWKPTWFSGPPSARRSGDIYSDLLVTGHHLEWLALLPSKDRPAEEVVALAGSFVFNSLKQIAPKDVEEHICQCSHGVRAYLVSGVRVLSN
jgi:hypothetical protein